MPPGRFDYAAPLPIDLLNEGAHHVNLAASIHAQKWICEPGKSSPSITFNVMGPLSDSPYWRQRREGAVAPVQRWTAVHR